MTVDLQEGLLQHVGRIGVAREPARQAKDARLVPPDDRLEGRVVPGRGARGERLVARFRRGDDHAHRIYRLLIAALTFAASSGVTSVMPWSCAAWATTFFISSSSVAALAVNGQPGTIVAAGNVLGVLRSRVQAFSFSFWKCSGLHLEMPARAFCDSTVLPDGRARIEATVIVTLPRPAASH